MRGCRQFRRHFGDIIFAETKALIGFRRPRTIKATHRASNYTKVSKPANLARTRIQSNLESFIAVLKTEIASADRYCGK